MNIQIDNRFALTKLAAPTRSSQRKRCSIVTDFDLSSLFAETNPLLCLSHGQRSDERSEGLRRTLDSFDGAACLFHRGSTEARFRLDGDYRLLRCTSGGWLLHNRDSAASNYWLPTAATLRRVSEQGHILEERAAELVSFDLDTSGVTMAFESIPDGWTLDMVVWRLLDAALIEELQALLPIETQGYFLLGSHTRYGKPADLYRHLVHGWVYEDRYAWPHKRRICSENDAHALYLVFSGLEKHTRKKIYTLLKRQLILAVLSRQEADGGFRHGEWTDGMESHYRLANSALHLLLDAWQESGDPALEAPTGKLATWLSQQRDTVAGSPWFLHDSLEHTEAGMGQSPFRYAQSHALGKSPSNMLVINTHLDIAVSLNRYAAFSKQDDLATLSRQAVGAARAVLSLRPAEWLYRLVFSAINLTVLPVSRAQKLPLWKRIWKRIGWQVFIPRLYRLKARYPRLVMPGGYVDRALPLKNWSFHYLTVNLMDMARFRQRFGAPWLDAILAGGVSFTRNSGILDRWAELNYERYALGFWAEALYALGLKETTRELAETLAHALTTLNRLNMGTPPSLLGYNGEYGPPPTPPALEMQGLLCACWPRDNGWEVLLANPGTVPLNCAHGTVPADSWIVVNIPSRDQTTT